MVVDDHAYGREVDKLDPDQEQVEEHLVDHELLQHDPVVAGAEDAYSDSQLLQ